MRASFPTAFPANLVGKSREGGEFDKGDGVTVKYGDGYLIAFENSEGLTQTTQVSLEALQKAANFDVLKQPKYAAILVKGDVKIYDDGGAFVPIEVTLATKAS